MVCAGLLTGVGKALGPYKQANERADEVRNILRVLGVPFDPKAGAKDLLKVYEKNVREEKQGSLTFHAYVSEGSSGGAKAVAVPFAGSGLWGPVAGFLALDPDRKTIHGITFYKQEETPGLGGEISSDWFCAR